MFSLGRKISLKNYVNYTVKKMKNKSEKENKKERKTKNKKRLKNLSKESKSSVKNPKEEIGQAKPSLHHVPPRVLIEIALAMMEGSRKYGIYNYRKAGVSFSTYYSSTFRHLISWFEGEDIDPDSGVSHVTKAISGLIVLRDSMLENNFIDDRPNTKTK